MRIYQIIIKKQDKYRTIMTIMVYLYSNQEYNNGYETNRCSLSRQLP